MSESLSLSVVHSVRAGTNRMIETTLRLPPRYVFCAICTIPVWIFVLSNSSSPNYNGTGARYTTASLPPVMFDASLEQAEPDRESKPDRPAAPRKIGGKPP